MAVRNVGRDECHAGQGIDCIIGSVPAGLSLGSFLASRKEHTFSRTAIRRGMSDRGCCYPYFRSASPISLDALGRKKQRGSLARLLECCYWRDIVRHGVPASDACKTAGLNDQGAVGVKCPAPFLRGGA